MGWIPSIIEESHSGVREISLYTKHLMNRKIFLQGEIDQEMADMLLSQILYLADEEKPIDLYLNSSGGDAGAGLMIYDVLQSVETPVNLWCTGMAASVAALILAGGQKGRRFILPHSRTMLHRPVALGGMEGFAVSSGQDLKESLRETKRIVNGLLAKHTGRTPEEIERATGCERYLNAEESVAFGLCDGIKEKIV
ncbi:MAG: ATP-dependent Clp protease proteolytic subunit [Muribaculum sp.]|nr:ATP-dependent Clp protease proteolytic subunit [Muribaculum sp.]